MQRAIKVCRVKGSEANESQFLDSRPNTPITPRGRGGFVERSADDKAAFLPVRELEQLRVSGGNDENNATTNGSS